MKIFIFDSLSRTKKEFIPINSDQIKIYACGPTVYDYAHIGNARMAVVTDLLLRVLRKKFSNVSFVSNITDIDDKIIKASKNSGISINSLTERFHKIYNQDMSSLNVQLPDIQPKATDYIDDMIEMIVKLLKNKCAYIADKHVIFDVKSYKYYGKLSRRSIDEQIAGARVEVADFKKNSRDFVLWKPSVNDEPGWDSPWGRGRPGWHIECSAMSYKCLNMPFDIHCGGVDLTFPHHENEIAQSCSAFNINSKPEDFCRYWFHNGFVTANGEKMSKSLGNIKLVNELLKNYDGRTIRLSLISAHYRQPLNWTEEILKQSKITISRIDKNLEKAKDIDFKKLDLKNNKYFLEFQDCLLDDLNSPKALGFLNGLFNLVKKTHDSHKPEIFHAISEGLNLLGLRRTLNKNNEFEKETIIKLINERDHARKIKDFVTADKIREQLKEIDVDIEDTDKGTTWIKSK